MNFPEPAPPAPSADLARAIGHSFAEPELLAEALTHPSALGFVQKGRRGIARRSNQRLEFLGDRVLGLAVADMLWRRFPDETEGHLTRRLAELVRAETLAEVAAELDLGRYLVLSPELATAANRPTFLADAMEAVIAALYFDGGYAAAANFVQRLWEPLIERMPGPPRSPKTRLQEWSQAHGLGFPDYILLETTGPEHARRFTMAAKVTGHEPATATAPSKQLAQEQAAARLLETLSEEPGRRRRRR